ncbi:MAG: type IV pilus assembly protein FimV [Woeseiaceae bacterium]
MNAPLRSKNKKVFAVSNHHRTSHHRARNNWPALLALGGSCAFVCGPAAALELGQVEVQSTLGQPLRAGIAFALNPNEQIHAYCIYLNAGRAVNGLPNVSQASIAVSEGIIRITGHTAVQEPLLALQLTVDCPYAANLTREYSVFVNPQSASQRHSAEPVAEAAVSQSPSATVAPRGRVAAPRPTAGVGRANQAPVTPGRTYRVQRGDTLSGIAQRIDGRTVSIWQAVDVIFAANPAAFLDQDRDLLKAGALLVIPDTLQAARDVAQPQPVTIAEAAETGKSSAGYRTEEHAPVPQAEPAQATPRAAPVEGPRAPRSGDVSVGADSPFVTPVEAAVPAASAPAPFDAPTEVIPETPIAVPAASRPPAAAARGHDTGAGGTGASWSWLLWLGGSGIALILGLLLFGRTLRNRFSRDPAPLSGEQGDGRRASDDEGAVARADEDLAEVDFRFDGPVPDARMIALDADLDAGTGFQDGGDIDVAQDFGFSASGDLPEGLDIEFGDEPMAWRNEESPTVITAKRRATDGIVVSESPRGGTEELSQYDLSMIVDATRQPLAESDATTKDLKAIELDAEELEPIDAESLTLNGDGDFSILEQDYEDELTATQAFNAELAAAAQNLSRERHAGADDSAEPELPTVESVALDMDLTAALPQSGNDTTAIERTVEVPGDLDDTGVNEEITTRTPAAENDAMADLEVESSMLDTRKMKIS